MSTTQIKSQIMSASEIDRTLVRLAHEILERNGSPEHLAVVGIQRRGFVLAERLRNKLVELAGGPVALGKIGISLYNDDLSTVAKEPVFNGAHLPPTISASDVVLVDDVLYTGRTVRKALDVLFAQGEPATVQLCVLIDRGHRKLPIEARFVGKFVETSDTEIIEVKVTETDGEERVLLVEREGES
jgi:pyrimidine operon attenuation protein/uracil phosphoribosyltransferase